MIVKRDPGFNDPSKLPHRAGRVPNGAVSLNLGRVLIISCTSVLPHYATRPRSPAMQTCKRKQAVVTKLAASALSLFVLFLLAGWTPKVPSSADSSAAELTGHVRFLSSDELMGRGVDTAGIHQARDYIGEQFKKYGLLPGGDGATYFQGVEVVTGAKLKEGSELTIADLRLIPDRQWAPLGFSASGKADGELVFVGYGITAEDYGYDDYAGADVKGKIAVVLRYEPPPKNDRSPFRKHPKYSRHAALRTKADTARQHGAVGMILVDHHSAEEGEKQLIPLRRTLGRSDLGLVVAQITREVLDKALAEKGISLGALKEKIDRDERPASVPLGLRASLEVQIEKVTGKGDNVIGVLPGAAPLSQGEHIIIGAHYDHIGLGYYGTRDGSTEGQIHHGADDNASGTALLLLLAQELSRRPDPLPVSVVFVAFTGEELGLYGSRRYVIRPALSLRSAKIMINLDMVGRMKNNRLMVAGVDTAKEFRGILNQAGSALEVEMRPGVARSDHVSFYDNNISVLHFYTGVHEDYHRPTDTWEKLNVEGIEKISRVVLITVEKIANDREPLTFVRLPSPSGMARPTPTSPPQAPNP